MASKYWTQLGPRGGRVPLVSCGHFETGRAVSLHEFRGWWVYLWTEVDSGGRRVVRELDVRPAQKEPPDPGHLEKAARRRWRGWEAEAPASSGGLAAADVRDLAMGALLEQHSMVVRLNPKVPSMGSAGDRVDDGAILVSVSSQDLRLLPLLEVAEAYEVLVMSGDRTPAKTLAERSPHQSVRTIQDRIAKARQAGLLSPGRAGEVGGQLTERARELRSRLGHTERA